MGNLGRIKKGFVTSTMDTRTKRRLFRGVRGAANRSKLKRMKLVAKSSKVKDDAGKAPNQELPKTPEAEHNI